jgi:hypothetical protein
MRLSFTRRLAASFCALLQLVLVAGAPLVDAAFERSLGDQTSVSAPDRDGQQAPTRRPLHDEGSCVFCAAARATFERPASVSVEFVFVESEVPAVQFHELIAPQLFLIVAHSRAPPAVA